MNRARTIAIALTAALALAGCRKPLPPATPSAFVIRPYVQYPTTTEITVMWVTPGPCPVELRYGTGESMDCVVSDFPGRLVAARTPPTTATDAPATAPEAPAEPTIRDYLYEVRLTGLAPGTAYRYAVTAAGQTAEGTFRTSPDRPEPFTFVAYGDSRTGHAAHRRVGELIRDQNPAFIIHSGDLTNTGPYDQYHAHYFKPLEDVIDHIAVWPVLGNHEGDGVAFRRLFALPNNERWYSFDYANAHFVGLDSTAGTKNLPLMLAWLEEDLAASKAEWKIVYYHHPSYDIAARHTEWGRLGVLPILRRYGVDLVFAGHSHSYQRFHPMFTAGENDDRPITHVISAGGGAGLVSIENSPYLAAGAKKNHAMFITIDGPRLSARTLTPDGAEIDAFEISKAGGRFAPDYLARALPEGDFDTLRDLIFPHLRGIALAELPQPGRPVTVSLTLGAGDLPMNFTLKLDGGGHYVMRPAAVSGQTPAGGTTEVTVTIAAKGTTETKGSALDPAVRFLCEYEINGQRGSVLGGVLRHGRPGATEPDLAPEPVRPTHQEN